jgi:hypothetical protein
MMLSLILVYESGVRRGKEREKKEGRREECPACLRTTLA